MHVTITSGARNDNARRYILYLIIILSVFSLFVIDNVSVSFNLTFLNVIFMKICMHMSAIFTATLYFSSLKIDKHLAEASLDVKR